MTDTVIEVNTAQTLIINDEYQSVVITQENLSPTILETLAGQQGVPGPAPVLTFPAPVTGAAGSNASVAVTGTNTTGYNLTFTIPRGDTGATGPANTLTIGTVTTLPSTSSATATITGTAPNQTLNLGIPEGSNILSGTSAPTSGTGVQGDWYINTTTWDMSEKTSSTVWTVRLNIRGATGPANTLTVGTVTTGAPGSSVAVTITGTAPNQTINLTIPRGDVGPAPTLNQPTVTALAPTATPTASFTGTNPYTLVLGLPAAPQMRYGDDASRTSGLGQPGDTYTVTTGATNLGNVYLKTNTTTWTLQGNIRGAAGTGNVSAGAGTIGNVVTYAAADGSLIQDSGFAASDVVRLTQTQTITGAKTFSALITGSAGATITGNVTATTFVSTSAGSRFATFTHTTNAPEGLVLTNTTAGITNSPRLFFITVNGGSGIRRDDSGALIFSSGANPGTSSGATTTMTITDAGAVNIPGSMSAASFSGSGANLTNLPGGNLTGTIPIGVIPTGTTGTTVALGNHNHDTVYVALSGAQTIAGVKTFSSAPVFSSGIQVTGGVVATSTVSGSNLYGGNTQATGSVPSGGASAAVNPTVTAVMTSGQAAIGVYVPDGTNNRRAALVMNQTDGVWGLTQTQTTGAIPFIIMTNGAEYFRIDPTGTPLISLKANTAVTGTLSSTAGFSATTGTFSGAITATGATFSGLTASRVLTTSTGGLLAVSAVTTTELGYLSGVTSAIQTQLGGKEASITAGTTAQYWRGDKSWQTLDKTAVGLSNINNVAQVEIAGSQTITGIKTFSAGLAVSGGQWIYLGASGTGAPTFTTRSAGTKIVLYDSLTGSTTDSAIGMDVGTLWNSVGGTGSNFKWYGGTTLAATLTGTGTFSTTAVTTTATTGSVNTQRFIFTVATAARPTGTAYVEWVGPVQPNNAIDGDTWVNTA